jgi:hypothetical protein
MQDATYSRIAESAGELRYEAGNVRIALDLDSDPTATVGRCRRIDHGEEIGSENEELTVAAVLAALGDDEAMRAQVIADTHAAIERCRMREASLRGDLAKDLFAPEDVAGEHDRLAGMVVATSVSRLSCTVLA